MKISGFSFVKNGIKLYYPIVEAIKSILPICNEFVVAVGESDSNDSTRDQIEAIGSDKIKIINTVWEKKHCKRGAVNAIQTDIAKNACSGDWLFYLQADEVVHEKYLPTIEKRCQELLGNDQVEGLLFDYKHFWGDYDHYHDSHGWYPNEVRIIRNLPNIHSWQSAQSFRYFENYEHPHQIEGTRKLRVAKANAEIYHYGWVRPPHLMQNKRKALESVHKGAENVEKNCEFLPGDFDYGPLHVLRKFDGTHPDVMKNMIENFNWREKLQYSGKPNPERLPHKHELPKYKFITWLERYLFGGKKIGTFKNYNLLKNL